MIGFAGRLAPGAEDLVHHGFAAVVPILRGASDLPAALAAGERNLELAVETAAVMSRYAGCKSRLMTTGSWSEARYGKALYKSCGLAASML